MKVLDLNLLVYAVDERSPFHERARIFVESCFSGEERIGIPWIVLVGFLRVTTHPRILARSLSPETATGIVDGWLKRRNVVALEPGPKHWTILRQLIQEAQVTGNLNNDAHIATLAIEHGGEVWSADTDFGRFRGLRWSNPLLG